MSVTIKNDLPRITAAIRTLQGAVVRVGVIGDDLVLIARYNEYGVPSKNIPERIVWRFVAADPRTASDFKKIVTAGIQRIIDGGEPETMLERVGVYLVGRIKDRYQSDVQPENAPSTLARKTPETRTLIDTRRLIGSVFYEVAE